MTPQEKQQRYYRNLIASTETGFLLELKSLRKEAAALLARIDGTAAAELRDKRRFIAGLQNLIRALKSPTCRSRVQATLPKRLPPVC